MSLRIAALVKQIPAFESMRLGPDGRLVRDGLELEMSAYCRRAVAQAVALAEEHGGEVIVLTMGPPSAEDALREAIAWANDRGVEARGVHLCDPACAGADTLATARALTAALTVEGPFDLVLAGRNSVDADTGQVGPQVAELLGLPFVTGARHLALAGGVLDVRAEHDDGWAQLRVALPAVVSTAERLVDPCKVDPAGRASVPSGRIRTLTAADLGPGPWGAAGSPTRVGATRIVPSDRERRRAAKLALTEQVARAVEVLESRGALDREPTTAREVDRVPDANGGGRLIGVAVEPGREALSRELLGEAAALGGPVVALVDERTPTDELGSRGADQIVEFVGVHHANEEDTAAGIITWARDARPWAILAPSTAWGREVAARTAAALGTGLTGDAVALERDGDELVAWKPAFGGQLVAAIHCSTRPQMVTVRAGVLRHRRPRDADAAHHTLAVTPHSRVEILARARDDDLDVLAEADAVIGVGQGVDPADYPALDPLAATLGAEIAATRKVTDQGWMPRARQLGITGRTITPRLFVSIGASGKFNHMVGVRTAGTILAINPDPAAPVHDAADASIIGDYREVLPLLVTALRERGQAG